MMIQSMNSTVQTAQLYKSYTKTKTAVEQDTTDKTSQETETTEATTQAAAKLDKLTYSKTKENYTQEVNALLEQHEQQILSFKQSILSMVSKQENTFKVSLSMFNLDVYVTNDQIEEAKASIAEGGEWSVNAVADRIMDMAYALSGGDDSKLELLKNAVISGFKAAGFQPDDREGCGMPSITGDTYDEIMKRFDQWSEQANASTDTEQTETE